MALHFTTRMLYDRQRRTAVKPINTMPRFDAVLAMARNTGDDLSDIVNQNAYAAGYLASMVVGLETELEAAKQEIQAAVQQLHEYVEAEAE